MAVKSNPDVVMRELVQQVELLAALASVRENHILHLESKLAQFNNPGQVALPTPPLHTEMLSQYLKVRSTPPIGGEVDTPAVSEIRSKISLEGV